MAKISLVPIGKREWSKIVGGGFDSEGELIEKVFVSCLSEKGAMEFSCSPAAAEKIELKDVLKFSEKEASEFNLKANFNSFQNKMKYSLIEEE